MSCSILIVSPLKKMSGNYSTAVRLWNHFASRGNKCLLEASSQFSDCEQFIEFLHKNKIEFIISLHAYHSGRILEGCDVPYVVILGGTDVHEYTRDADKLRLMTAVLRKARKIVAFGKPLAEEVLNKWPTMNWSKIRVIPQAVSTKPSAFSLYNYLKSCGKIDLDQDHFSTDNPKIFIVVGGIRPVKDPLYLLNTFSDWHINNGKTAYLVFVGPVQIDGDYGQTFLDQVKKSEGVAYVDGLCTEDTHAAIRDSTALVNSSTSEGMAAAILEAMELGTPVIARDIPANCDVIEHRITGLLYNQPRDFVRMAELLLTSPDLRDLITRRAKQQVVEKHSLKTEFQAYSLLVEQSLNDDQR